MPEERRDNFDAEAETSEAATGEIPVAVIGLRGLERGAGAVQYRLIENLDEGELGVVWWATPGEIARINFDVEPSKPSTRLRRVGDFSTVLASAGRVDLRAPAGDLRVDPDWLVNNAMATDLRRGYYTATSPAEEIRRRWWHEAVLAGGRGWGASGVPELKRRRRLRDEETGFAD